MEIDVVIVSNAFNTKLWFYTQNSVRTAINNAGVKVGKCVVVEQHRTAQAYKGAEMLYYDFPFNYNRCLNLGRSVCKSPYIAFCNNDLYFADKWAKNCIKAMQGGGFLSASPCNMRHGFRGVKQGYEIGKKILGWCIVTNVEVFDYIGKFDEAVEFWYSDNVYGHQLQKAGISHILVGESVVRHFVSRTLEIIGSKKKEEYKQKQRIKFDNYVLANPKE